MRRLIVNVFGQAESDRLEIASKLPGWEASRGANIERNYALRRGKIVCEYPNLPGQGGE